MKKITFTIYSFLLLSTQLLMGDLNIHTSQSHINGDSITAWENYTPSGANVFASLQIAGVWLSAVPIGNPLTFPIQPNTAINSLGEVVVVWIGNEIVTFTPSLYASVYSSGVWTTSLISDPSLEFVTGEQQVKIAENSATVVTWGSYMFASGTNEARGIYAPTYGVWPAPATLP